MSEYIKRANDFCKTTGTKITFSFVGENKAPWDNNLYNEYVVRIDRNHKTMRVHFYDSLNNTHEGKRPTKYDILACITKYEPGTFSDFCADYGYTEWADCYEDATPEGYDKKSFATYKAVAKEWGNVYRLFGDVLSDLQEIA